MKVAILGTRGIPNYHGGFEQFAEFFSVFLNKEGIDIYVYCSSKHPYKDTVFNGVTRIVCNDPEDVIGTAGQFIYDLNCIRDVRKRKVDIILQLGYTSSSIWSFLFPKKAIILTNMDGLEWKRSKYNSIVQHFLMFAEKLAVKNSDFLIADSIGIQEYLKDKYNSKSQFIAYGATLFEEPNNVKIKGFAIKPYSYDMLIARMEPENNIEMVIKGHLLGSINRKLLIIGNYEGTKFGRFLFKTYGENSNIMFLGAIYDMDTLNNLRYFSNLYFHGHSVGGTNPSLLEAMASNCCIVAHNNVFNQSLLGDDAFYFTNEEDIVKTLDVSKQESDVLEKIANNKEKIRLNYNWDTINNQYLNFLKKCLKQKK